MKAFPIEIDATKLVYRNFIIPGKTDWVDSRVVQTLMLETGKYNFQVASGYFTDVTFEITPEGRINYDQNFDVKRAIELGTKGFLSGMGSSRLTIVGLTVTLDARYLAGSGVLLVIPSTNEDWITYKTCQMVPASLYSVQQGSGVVTNFTFKLGTDGNFSYDEAYDIRKNGFLAGIGTPKLEFLGYPLLVDARAAGRTGVTIQPIWGMPFAYTSIIFGNLLPASGFALQTDVSTNATFQLGVGGQFGFDSSLERYLRLESFHGLTLLKVIAPLSPS